MTRKPNAAQHPPPCYHCKKPSTVRIKFAGTGGFRWVCTNCHKTRETRQTIKMIKEELPNEKP